MIRRASWFMLVVVGIPAVAAGGDTVELIDGTRWTDRAIARIIPGAGLAFEQGDSATPLEQVRRIERDVPELVVPLRAARLFLTDGSVLVAESLTINDGRVTFDAIVGDRVRWPLDSVRAITLRPLSVDEHGRAKPEPAFAEALADANAAEDRLFVFRDRDLTSVGGALAGMDGEGVRFIWSDESRRVALDKLYGLTLALTRPPRADKSGMWRVTFADGSTLWATSVALRGDELTVDLARRSSLVVPWDAVRSLDHRGRRMVFLSELEPVSREVGAVVTYAWPTRFDTAVTGEPLRLNGRVYERGIGMHAPASVTWALGPDARLLVATLGLDDAAADGGDCVFAVVVDGERRFERRIRAREAPVPCRVDLRGARRLTLTAEAGENLDIADHANWADARLIVDED